MPNKIKHIYLQNSNKMIVLPGIIVHDVLGLPKIMLDQIREGLQILTFPQVFPNQETFSSSIEAVLTSKTKSFNCVWIDMYKYIFHLTLADFPLTLILFLQQLWNLSFFILGRQAHVLRAYLHVLHLRLHMRLRKVTLHFIT